MVINSIGMDKNFKFNLCGYVILVILAGTLSGSPNNQISWLPENIALAPGPVILVSPPKEDEKACEDISSDECLKKLQTFMRLKSLPFPTNEKELDKLCSTTIAGYNCSATKSNIPNCLTPREKELFPTFTGMAEFTMYMFCVTQAGEVGFLRDAMLQNSECIMKQKEALGCCAEGAKLADLPVLYFLEKSSKSMEDRQIDACCPIANFLKCASTVLEKNCGAVAANLTTMYVRESSGEPTEAACQKIPDYPEPNSEICKTPPPVCSGSRAGILLELIALMSFLLVTRISYI